MTAASLETTKAALTADNIMVRFGGLVAVKGVTFTIRVWRTIR